MASPSRSSMRRDLGRRARRVRAARLGADAHWRRTGTCRQVGARRRRHNNVSALIAIGATKGAIRAWPLPRGTPEALYEQCRDGYQSFEIFRGVGGIAIHRRVWHIANCPSETGHGAWNSIVSQLVHHYVPLHLKPNVSLPQRPAHHSKAAM